MAPMRLALANISYFDPGNIKSKGTNPDHGKRVILRECIGAGSGRGVSSYFVNPTRSVKNMGGDNAREDICYRPLHNL